MCHNNYNTKEVKFKQLSWENRLIIEHMYNIQKKNYSEIAKELGKHRTTISRDIKRGLIELETSYLPVIKYSAEIAQQVNEFNETAKGTILKIDKDIKLAKYIENEIRNKISPEVISSNIKKDSKFNIKLHWKTIYNYIDKNILDIKRKDLTYGKYKKKHKEQRSESLRSKMSKVGKTIHDRPSSINNREVVGHWEMDLVEGLKKNNEPYLLVLSDKNWLGIEKSYTQSKIKRTTQYFADAYSSWQRGTNENINKMIRRFLPKGTSFKNLTNDEVSKIEEWINNYPRKMFNFDTSQERYNAELTTV